MHVRSGAPCGAQRMPPSANHAACQCMRISSGAMQHATRAHANRAIPPAMQPPLHLLVNVLCADCRLRLRLRRHLRTRRIGGSSIDPMR